MELKQLMEEKDVGLLKDGSIKFTISNALVSEIDSFCK